MKNLPHYSKQLNKKTLRSEKQENAELIDPFRKEESEKQVKKKAKLEQKKVKQLHTPHPQSIEERNIKMKHRTPIFDKRFKQPRKPK